MTQVELLREAAKTMRFRAGAATDSPWEQSGYNVHAPDSLGGGHGVCYDTFTTADAEHIASWHPAVALAVADWLLESSVDGGISETRCAVAVARAYLGGES